jgi:hypothetical protein
VVCVTLAILVGILFVAIYAVVMISIYGIAGVFKQSYAAYFFGGRYPQLGDLLEPPPPEVEATTWVSPPPGNSLGEPPPVW